MIVVVRPTCESSRTSLPGRRPITIIGGFALAALVFGGCADDPPADTTATIATTPDLASSLHRFEPAVRFGSGRGVAAAAQEPATVVATTIGVNVHRGGAITELATDLTMPIIDLIVADDGSSAVLVGSTSTGELWDLDSALLLATYDSAVSAHFSADGGSVDVVGVASVVRTSTVDGSTVVEAPRARPGSVASVAWYGPEPRALLVPGDSTSRSSEIWTGSAVIDSGYEPGGLSRVGRARGDPHRSRAVLGITGGTPDAGSLVSLDLATGSEHWRRDIGIDAVRSTWDVGHDGRILAVVGSEVRLFAADGSLERSDETAAPIEAVVALTPTPGYAVIGTQGEVDVVDELGKPVGEAAPAGKRLVHWATTGHGLVGVDVDGRVRQWDTSGDLVADIDDYVAAPINAAAVSTDGSMAAAAGADGSVAVVELSTSQPVRPLAPPFMNPEGGADTVAFAPDSTAVVSGVAEANGLNSFDNTLARWDLQTGRRGFAVAGDAEPVRGCTQFRNTVEFSPDGEFFVSPFHDYTVSIRDAHDGSVIHEFPAHGDVVWDIAISRDGRRLATSSADWTLRVWDLDDRRLVSEFDTLPGGFRSIVFTSDGGTMVVSDVSGSLYRLDLVDGSLSAPFDGTKHFDSRISLSPDGRYVAAGSSDSGAVLIWDRTTGRVVQELRGHGSTVTGAAFAPDGHGLVSGSEDGTIRYWMVT
jgi:WD40 repeat protein